MKQAFFICRIHCCVFNSNIVGFFRELDDHMSNNVENQDLWLGPGLNHGAVAPLFLEFPPLVPLPLIGGGAYQPAPLHAARS